MNNSPYIDRKEICVLLHYEISEHTIGNREKEWGLDKVRVKFKKWPVLYYRKGALTALRDAGILVS